MNNSNKSNKPKPMRHTSNCTGVVHDCYYSMRLLLHCDWSGRCLSESFSYLSERRSLSSRPSHGIQLLLLLLVIHGDRLELNHLSFDASSSIIIVIVIVIISFVTIVILKKDDVFILFLGNLFLSR